MESVFICKIQGTDENVRKMEKLEYLQDFCQQIAINLALGCYHFMT
jgi:hypothetical protein